MQEFSIPNQPTLLPKERFPAESAIRYGHILNEGCFCCEIPSVGTTHNNRVSQQKSPSREVAHLGPRFRFGQGISNFEHLIV